MKKYLIPASYIVGSFIFLFCGLWVFVPIALPGYHIQQEIRTDCGDPPNLTTWVYHNGEIITFYQDNINTIDDSTKIKRRMQAKELIRRLKQ